MVQLFVLMCHMVDILLMPSQLPRDHKSFYINFAKKPNLSNVGQNTQIEQISNVWYVLDHIIRKRIIAREEAFIRKE